MKNPWCNVPLKVYEAHMGQAQVAQLQTLNQIMESQWQANPKAVCAAILGVAGGNGLEYCGANLKTIYAVDINPDYLRECGLRFRDVFGDRLQLVQMDLTGENVKLPKSDLILADLLIEYVGVECFCKVAAQSQAEYVSCVIQHTESNQDFVSNTPYQSQLEGIGALHRDITAEALSMVFSTHGYEQVLENTIPLPNGKYFVRVDYRRKSLSKEREGDSIS